MATIEPDASVSGRRSVVERARWVADTLRETVVLTRRLGIGPRDLVLDVGSGTGALAIAALQTWPRHQVTGIDPSGGMLEVASTALKAAREGEEAEEEAAGAVAAAAPAEAGA